MAMLTLHRAGRIQEQIGSRIGRMELEAQTRLSIFSSDPDAEVERRARELWEDMTRLQHLASVRATLRAAIAQQNAETGISALLAEKAALEEEVALLSPLLDRMAPDFEAWAVTRRRRRLHASRAKRGQVALAEQIAATRSRFEAGEGTEETEILVSLIDDALEQEVRLRILERRRRLDEISDRLRSLNSSATIELADDALEYLQREAVV